jgi:Holliday junction resolvase RusA-like endonuclease
MPAPRPRATGFVAGKKVIISMYSPPAYKEWQKGAAAALQRVPGYDIPLAGPLQVDLRVELPRPKTTKLPHPKPDVDNFAKSVLDAITKDGRFWSDDSQVQTLTITKAWGTEGSIQVTIREL